MVNRCWRAAGIMGNKKRYQTAPAAMPPGICVGAGALAGAAERSSPLQAVTPRRGPLALLATGYWVLATCHWPLATGYWVLATGHYLLATGYWVLATGYWPLATGHWVLATGHQVLAPPPLPPACKQS